MPGDSPILRSPVAFEIAPRDFPAKRWKIAGWLSAPETRADVLLVLIHGGACDHLYWDMPYEPQIYSCVEWAYGRGLATLNIDRLGAGDSSHPPGRSLTLQVNADALAQLVAQIRSGGVLGQCFSKIVTVGHSLGSLTAAYAQATWDSADGVVLTGVTGANVRKVSGSPQAVAASMSVFRPARLAPALAARADRFDDDYHVLSPKVRKSLFFRSPPADPRMIEADLQAQGVMTLGEFRTQWLGFEASSDITKPALVQLGEFDPFYFNPRAEPDARRAHADAREQNPPNFTMAPLCLGCGHNLAQHPMARDHYEAMLDWLRENGFV